MQRTAIITGDSNGIGRAAVRMMAQEGINVMTTGLAKELGRYGITVNAVLPGVITTKINSWQFAVSKFARRFVRVLF